MKFTICDDSPSDLLTMENVINQYAKINNISIDIEKHNSPESLIKRVMFGKIRISYFNMIILLVVRLDILRKQDILLLLMPNVVIWN